MPDTHYARELGRILRSIRKQQGLSLQKVEETSRGRWKAVVVGSYERGDRSITVAKLAELADFYGVPVNALIPSTTKAEVAPSSGRLTLDLAAIIRVAEVDSSIAPLSRYVAAIQSQRGDYNGKVLTIRAEDLRTLCVIFDLDRTAMLLQLAEWNVLLTPPVAEDLF